MGVIGMKRKNLILAALFFVVTMTVCTGSAFAALLGVQPGYPLITFDSLSNPNPYGITYDPTTGIFRVSSSPVSYAWALRKTTPISGAKSVSIQAHLDSAGALISDQAGDEIVINGDILPSASYTGPAYAGPLLTGKITKLGFYNGGTTDSFDVRFTPTGGSLYDTFKKGDVGVVLTAENSTFNGSFAAAFQAYAKGTVGYIVGPHFDLTETCTDATGQGAIQFSATITNTGTENLNTISCTNAPFTTLTGVPTDLAIGATATITGSYQPDATPSTGTLSCSATGAGSQVIITKSASATCNVVATPALTLAETCTNASAPGQPITISGLLTNTGNETLTGFSCSDSSGLISLSGVPATLTPNSTATVTGSYVPTASNSASAITCTAKGVFHNTTVVSATSSATCNIVTNPSFTVAETCTNATAPGQPINITATIKNTGNETLSGFICTDNNSAVFTGVPASLGAGLSATVTGTYTPTASGSTDAISCSATGAINSGAVSASSNNATCNILTNPAVTVAASCADAPAPGQNISISAVVTNSGNELLNGFNCTDSRGATLAGVPTTLAAGATATVTGSYLSLVSGSSSTITCGGTGAINSAVVSANSSSTCNVKTAPAITVALACTNAPAPGQPMLFTATLTNSGNENLTAISCTDTLGSTLAVGDIVPTGSSSLTFSYTQATSPLSNTVTCSAKGAINAASVSGTSAAQSCTIVTPAYPSIDIMKYISTDGKTWLHTDLGNILKVALCPTCEQDFDKEHCDYNHDGSCDEKDVDHCKLNKVDCDNQDKDHGRSKRHHRCHNSSNKEACEGKVKDAHERNHGDYNKDGKCDEKDIDYCTANKADCDKRDAEHRSTRRAYRCDDSSSKSSCEAKRSDEEKADKGRSDYDNNGKCDENDIDFCKANRAACDQFDKERNNLKRRFRCDDSSNSALCEDKAKEEDDKDRSDYNNDGKCDDRDVDFCKANRSACDQFDKDHGNSRRKHRCDDSSDRNACEEKARQEHDKDRCDYNKDGKCDETDVSYCKANRNLCEKHDRDHDNCKRTFRCDDSSNKTACEGSTTTEHDKDHSDYNHDGKCDEKDVDFCKGNSDKCDKHDKDHGKPKRSYRCDDSSNKATCGSYSQIEDDRDRSDYNRDGKCDEKDIEFCKNNSEDCVKHDKSHGNPVRTYRCDDSAGKAACEALRTSEGKGDKDNSDYNRDGKCDEKDVDFCKINSAACDKFDSDRGKSKRGYRCDDSSNKASCESKAKSEHDRDYSDYNHDGKCDEKDIDHCKANSDDCEKHDRDRGGNKHSYRCDDSADRDGCEKRAKDASDWYDSCIASGGTYTTCGKVYFKFVVTDTGTTNLTNLTLTDNVYSLSSCTVPATLAPNGSFTCIVGPFAAQSGQHMDIGTATGVNDGVTVTATDSAYYFGCNGAIPKSPGYWKNHAEAWPVVSIVIGGTTYTKAQAISLMNTPVTGDKTYSLFKAFVAAKLNSMGCSDSSCVTDAMLQADAWMRTNPVGSAVTADSAAWKAIELVFMTLDDYDNGKLCGGPGTAACTDSHPPPPPAPVCEQCNGGVTKLILLYKGKSNATVEVKDSNNVSLYKASVVPNTGFIVNGKAANGSMGQYVKIYVDGDYKATIATDCSKTIYPGMGVGKYFTVAEGYGLNNVKFCRISSSSKTSDDDDHFTKEYCDGHKGESSCSDFFDYKKSDGLRSWDIFDR
jgi:uncharacterized repeat protein (TIGR01451 family)